MVDLSKFWVVTPYFNSVQHQTRPLNYWRFMKMCEAAGVNVLTVEVAFGNRPFEVTSKDNPNHVQLRSQQEFFMKEVIINQGVRYLVQQHPELVTSSDAIVAWIDSDCAPVAPPREWFEKTKEALDHHKIVQMFEWLIELGPDYQVINGPHRGFMANYVNNGRKIPKKCSQKGKDSESGYGHPSLGGPGLAWAARLSTLTEMGMLLDICILGAGDWWMAHSMLGLVDPEANEIKRMPEYGNMILQYQERCDKYVKRDVGYVKMTVYHWFHGVKEGSRFYGTRGQILIRNKYNPLTDLKVDAQGIYQIETKSDRQVVLKDDCRIYIHTRNEDSIPLRQLPNLPEYKKK